MRKSQSTLFMVLLSALYILLSKYSAQDDVIIGSPIAGRRNEELENVIGIFINILVLRNYPSGNKTFSDFLQEVKLNTLDIYENQEYPYEELVFKLNNKRDSERNPLLNTLFTLLNLDKVEISMDNLIFTLSKYKHKKSKFDLDFAAYETNDSIIFELVYCCEIFKESTCCRMAREYLSILNIISENIDIKISDITIVDLDLLINPHSQIDIMDINFTFE